MYHASPTKIDPNVNLALIALAQIYFSTIQILGAYAILLEDLLLNPIKAFLRTLSVVVDVPRIVGGLGLSCANSELSRFKTQLIMATLAPIALSLCVTASFAIRVVILNCDRARTSRTHIFAVLLLLYVTLPSISITIFKAFLCDSRPLGENGEGYLIADYSGASPMRHMDVHFPHDTAHVLRQ